jgi:hypothetical protein
MDIDGKIKKYLSSFNDYNNTVVFVSTIGGIGDNLRSLMFIFSYCLENKIKFLYKDVLHTDKFFKIRYNELKYNGDELPEKINGAIKPTHKFSINNNKIKITPELNNDLIFVNSTTIRNIEHRHGNNSVVKYFFKWSQIFCFSDIIKDESKKIINIDENYISIHIRLGDKYLENLKLVEFEKKCTRVKDIEEAEKTVTNKILELKNNTIFFTCENLSFKKKIKHKYNNIIINEDEIAHTNKRNTNYENTKNTIIDFYILCNSNKIFGLSRTGFSEVAQYY